MKIPDEIIAAARAAHAKFFPRGPFVSITLAQWALESGWGKWESGKNNYFGVKATKTEIADGHATLRWTHETLHGKYEKLPDYFADYDSLEGGFTAHAALLATSYHYARCQAAATPDAYAMALQLDGYATGIPGHPYGPSLINVMKQNNLYQYDAPPPVTDWLDSEP